MRSEWGTLTPADRKQVRRALLLGRLTGDPALDHFVMGRVPAVKQAAVRPLAIFATVVVIGGLWRALSDYSSEVSPQWLFWVGWAACLLGAGALLLLYRNLQRLERTPGGTTDE